MPLFSINMGREEIGKGKSQGTLRRMSATRHRGQCQACGNIKCKAQKSTFRSKAQRSTFRCKAQQSTYQGQGAARRTSGARCISGARRSKVHLRGKAQQGASQGQGATRSISGARHSKAHVRGKVQQGTCQGKVQQGTCQGKTQQGACQGKTQQSTCQGKTQGTCHGQDAMRHMSQARCREVHERHLTLVQVKGAFFSAQGARIGPGSTCTKDSSFSYIVFSFKSYQEMGHFLPLDGPLQWSCFSAKHQNIFNIKKRHIPFSL